MAMNATQFLAALEEIESVKGISKETVLTALEEAMVKGYRKELGGDDAIVRVNIDPEKGTIEMCHIKMVVEEVEDDFLEISVEDAKKVNKKYKAGDEFIIPASIDDLRKATAMSVKSILKQKFAEAEKNILYEAFKDKIDTMITGKIEKVDERGVSVNIGRTSVYLQRNQMIGDEKFNVGDNIKLFVSDVASGPRGAHIVVSRSNEGFLRCLFNEEIHEIYDGTIIIKAIAREAGERSKVAVYSEDLNVDPAGACIGPNGARIQKIVGQLGNGQAKEKIDIIGFSQNCGLYIMEALKPARVVGIVVDEEKKSATAVVKDDSLSLAIGRKGVNVRLAVKLTGFNIDIKTESDAFEEGLQFHSYEELLATEEDNKAKALIEARAAAARQVTNNQEVLPGLPEGYVAPQERHYEDTEESNEDLNEALIEASEKEEETVVAPKEEVKETVAPVTPAPKVEEEHKSVRTTTSLEDLEKSLEESSSKAQAKNNRKFNKNKKHEEETSEEKVSVPSEPTTRMSIYTEEELREMDEEDKRLEEEEEDEVDYDDYDEYYDDEK